MWHWNGKTYGRQRVRTPLILIGAICLIVVAAAARYPREPVYQNKPLTYWVQKLEPMKDRNGEAEMAIRNMGPKKVIPRLLGKARSMDAPYRRFYDSSWRFQGLVKRWLPSPRVPDMNRISFALKLLGPPAVPQLVAALRSPSQAVQTTALGALGMMGSDAASAAPDLIKLLEPSNQLRFMAIYTLHELGSNRVQAVPALIRLLQDRLSIPHATWLLGELGPQACLAIPELTRLMNDPQVTERARVAIALWRISHGTSTIPVLAMELEKAPSTRWEILLALGQIGPAAQPAIPSILRVISDPRLDAAPEGWRALAKIDPHAQYAEAAWSELLKDSKPCVRENAAIALWRLNRDTNMITVLIRQLESARTADSCETIMAALGEIGPPAKAAVSIILEKLRTADTVGRNLTSGATTDRQTNLAQVGQEALDRIDPERAPDGDNSNP